MPLLAGAVEDAPQYSQLVVDANDRKLVVSPLSGVPRYVRDAEVSKPHLAEEIAQLSNKEALVVPRRFLQMQFSVGSVAQQPQRLRRVVRAAGKGIFGCAEGGPNGADARYSVSRRENSLAKDRPAAQARPGPILRYVSRERAKVYRAYDVGFDAQSTTQAPSELRFKRYLARRRLGRLARAL